MRKFIHSDFEIDLSVLKITDSAENAWFTGTYFTKYTYPFTLPLTDDTDAAFNYISNHNIANSQTLFEGLYVHGNTMEKAELEIEECDGRTLSVSIRYGFDEFPNFGKKLTELPLLKFEVGDIYQHAKTIIPQTWPAVNYNFPQVHIDKIRTEGDETWQAFEKIINNYKNGEFLRNEIDPGSELTNNRNIIQPVPYLMYLIQQGVNEAGYVLKGDILSDADLQKMLIYTDCEYYKIVTTEDIPVVVPAVDYTQIIYNDDYVRPNIIIGKEFDITTPGRYRLSGTVRIRSLGFGINIYQGIFYREITLGYHNAHVVESYTDFTIDTIFETGSDGGPHELVLQYDGGYVEDDFIFNLTLTPIFFFNSAGVLASNVTNPNEVDLFRAVPEMTFGELFKMVLALKNMDIDTRGNEVWVNYLQTQIEATDVIDLSQFDIKYVPRKFNKGTSFWLRYQEVNSEEYTFTEVFQDHTGTLVSGFKTDGKTTEVPINALPLPLLYRNGVQSAHGFLQDRSRPMLILYDGLTGGLNLARNPAPLNIVTLHAAHYNNWFKSRIEGTSFQWTFLAYYEQLIVLTKKSRVHAYTNHHIVKTLSKTEVRPHLFEVEIEVEKIS